MKKLTLFALAAFLPLSILAQTFADKGYKFNIISQDEKTCEVTGFEAPLSYSKNSTIPSAIYYGNDKYTVIRIADYAFREKYNLESIVLPSTLIEIGASAFQTCSALISIDIPDNVTVIGETAFNNCRNLQTVKLPSNLTSISGGCFAHCYKLEEINIPSKVTTIEESAFARCEKLHTAAFGNLVKSIEKRAFADCWELQNAVLPQSLESIGYQSFQGCSKLQEINIPDKTTEIGDWAFSGCESLHTVTLGKSLSYIGVAAFEVYGLRNVILNCAAPPEMHRLGSFDSSVRFYAPSDKLEKYAQSAIWYGYEVNPLENFKMPVYTTHPYRYYDDGTIGYLNFEIPDPEADECIFIYSGTLGFMDFVVPATIEYGGRQYRTTEIAPLAFYLSYIESLEIPAGVKAVGTRACERAQYLKKISFGEDVAFIGYGAFGQCNNITSVISRNPVPPVFARSATTFENSTYAAELIIPEDAEIEYAFADGWKDFRRFREGNTDVKGFDFSLVSKADRTCKITGARTEISGRLEIPSTLTILGEEYKVISIGKNAFINNDRITEIIIPDNVEVIEECAFIGCGPDKVEIGKGLKKIGRLAFDGRGSVYLRDLSAWCAVEIDSHPGSSPLFGAELYIDGKKVENLVIPEDVTYIAPYAFYAVHDIKTVTIHDNVTEIGKMAFFNSVSLEEIKIGGNVSKIGEEAIGGIGTDFAIYSYNPMPPECEEGKTATTCHDTNATLFVPIGSVKAYSESPAWYHQLGNIKPRNLLGTATISLDQESSFISLADAVEKELTVSISPESALPEVEWESSDTEVVYISYDYASSPLTGKVRLLPISVGTATVTARCGDIEAHCVVNVSADGSSISLTDASEERIYATESGISLEGLRIGADISIYSADGILVYRAAADSENKEILVGAGIYIVRYNERTVKLAVR